MSTVYTIGFQRKALSQFIAILRHNRVDAVIDIRLRNTSQLAGYTKRDDLAFLLCEGFDIAYEHLPELAPMVEIYDAYRQDHAWPVYEEGFNSLLAERQADTIGHAVLSRYQAPCLLCSEPAADQCHRRLVAEYWANHIPNLTIIHL